MSKTFIPLRKVIFITVLSLFLAGCDYVSQALNTTPMLQEPESTESAQVTIWQTKTVPIIARPQSSQQGVAKFEQLGEKLHVTIQIDKPNSSVYPASIREGTCDNPGVIRYPLKDIHNSFSDTVIDKTYLATSEKLVVVVYGYANHDEVAGCGTIE